MSYDVNEQVGRIREYAGDKAEAAAEKLREGTARALDQIDAARESASDTYARSRKKAGEAYVDARDRTFRAAGTVSRFVNEHPLATAGAAVAAGALIAMLFPRGRAALKSAPALANSASKKALAAAKAARDAVEQSEVADAVRTRATEVASAALAKASEAASNARAVIAEADIPAAVKTRATEAAEAARDAIERARLPERTAHFAENAAARAGKAITAAGKAVSDRLSPK